MSTEPIAILKKRQGDRSQREFAREVGISAAYLTDLYLGRREPGPKVLTYLGLKKITTCQTTYRRAK